MNKEKKIILLLMFLVSFSILTCRKRLSAPINLYGIWVSDEGFCGLMFLDLKKDGKSEYGTKAPFVGCNGKIFAGKSRITSHHLYIGITQLQIISKPELVSGNDTMGWKSLSMRGRVTAQMTLKNGLFHGRNTYTFHKIKDY
jgi:hypothetical protein